ncbi:hypothetical protein WME75_27770 [Sorangium sp. So ce1014]|uniref:hypothetical protein n=1 Tax=Sorangium sp. So ce1014 TaxID=3133326 RepID=UPI003F648B7A
MTSPVDESEVFLIPMPGKRVARIPIAVLERYLDDETRMVHDPGEPESDVTAHAMSVDPATGASVWHTEWELGPCDYTDESGFPQSAYAWHRHPLGTEYTEIYQK